MKKLLLPLLLILSHTAFAAKAELGKPLPPLDVPKKGELVLEGDGITYKPWSSSSIPEGVPALVFHLPARMSADTIMKPLQTRLEQAQPAPGKHAAVSVINLDDALWGTAGIVAGELEKNKRRHPESAMVADDGSRGLSAWGLKSKTVYVMITNTEGNLIYMHDGPMDDADIEEIVTTLKAEIAKVETPAES